jgi:hypothetical protein
MEKLDYFIEKIVAGSGTIHTLRPPCPAERIDAIAQELGAMPAPMVAIIRRFNGAELFERSMQLLTLFGLSGPDTPGPPEWFIDAFTRMWRSGGGREKDWVFGITNYGGVLVMQGDGMVGEWDTAQRGWNPRAVPFSQWADAILKEGEEYMMTD